MTQSNGTIRPLVAGDLSRVIEIDENNTGRSRKSFFEKRVDAALQEAKEFIYIAYEENDQVEGYLLARLQQGEFGVVQTVAVLDDIGVSQTCQKKGVGQALMEELVKLTKGKDIHEIRSQVDWSDQSVMHYFAASGFNLAPRYVYEREAGYLDGEVDEDDVEPIEVDFSDPSADDSAALSRDHVPCRSLGKEDLPALVKIDRKTMGYDRSAYYDRKVSEVIDESGIRVSLVAELDEHVVGFVMARVDFGGFGKTEPSAVIDTLGVDPDYAHQNVGSALLSQLMANLAVLRADKVQTEVGAKQLDLIGFLQKNGFAPSQTLSCSRVV